MKRIGEWLAELRLEQYADLFEAHQIDLDSAAFLTPEMLRELGLPIGPRARLIAAIELLRASPPMDGSTPTLATRNTSPYHPESLERRQITILFCDLVDSTGLSRRLEAEDYRAVMRRYQQVCASAIAQHNGHIEQFLGDGIVAYFGWPEAEEVAAERSAFAGETIVLGVQGIEAPERLAVRVGISTGLVVVGEAARGNPAVPSGATGETPNIARRIQELATPNAVLVSESTQKLIQATFELEDLGIQNLRGAIASSRVYRLIGVKNNANRFLGLQRSRLSPLVDRQAELALLEQRWRDASEGEGHAVYVAGVPGIGKSRIVYELEQRIKAQARFVLRFQCSPHHSKSAFFPLIQELRRFAGIARDDSTELTLAKLEKLLSFEGSIDSHTLTIVAKLLSVDADPGENESTYTAEQFKEQILLVLREIMFGLARQGPTYCVIEDVQWVDPSSQELLDRVVDHLARHRFFMVLTHRPEYQPNLSRSGSISALTISRLARRDAGELARHVLSRELAIDSLVQKIVERSDSVPLFVEELARGALQTNDQRTPSKLDSLASTISSVPETLRDSLVSRLDRAPLGRQVAQYAAVIGREFSYHLLQRIALIDESNLQSGLDYLLANDVVQQSGSSEHFAFKHALLRDAAYETLVRSVRQDTHRRVAEAFLEDDAGEGVSHPELVAYHYGEAGLASEAVESWIEGAKKARTRSANLEAIAQLENAIEHATRIREEKERDGAELRIQLLLGLSCIAALGYSSDRTRAAFERAHELSSHLAEPASNFQAAFGLWGHYWMTADHPRALALARGLLGHSDAGLVPEAACVGHRSLGCTLFTKGNFEEARTELECAVRIGRALHERPEGSPFAVDPRIASQLILGWNAWVLGYPDQALQRAMEALQRAEASSDPYSIAFANYVTSAICFLRGEGQVALQHAEASLTISTEQRINLYALYSHFGRGCALGLLGDNRGSLAEMELGIREAESSNLGYMRAFMYASLAQGRLESQDVIGAEAAVRLGFEHVGDVPGRAWEAELHRLQGVIEDKERPDHPASLEILQVAIDIARVQRARSLELRAQSAYVSILLRIGKKPEGRARMAPLLESFREGLETRDIKAARTLLDKAT